MANTTQTQIVREDPAIEAYRLGLLESAKQLADRPVSLPQYQVAGMTGLQNLAAQRAETGVGSFIPFIQAGSGALGAGQTQIQQGAMPALIAATQTMEGAQPVLSQAMNLADLTRALPYQYQQLAQQGLGTAMQTAAGPTQLGVAELQNLARLGATTGGAAGANIQEAVAGLPQQVGMATAGGLSAAQQAAMQTGMASQRLAAGDPRLSFLGAQAGAGVRGVTGQLGQQLGTATAGGLTAAQQGAMQAGLAAGQLAAGDPRLAAIGAQTGAGVRGAVGQLGQQLGAATAGGLTAQQQAAMQAQQAIQGARGITGQAAGQAALAGIMGTEAARQAVSGLGGTGAQFQPGQISEFMSPYEDAAVQQALSDIRRQGQIAQQGIGAQAVGQGAFGGSRQAVAEQELGRNVLEQQARTAAQMRAQGFESAAQRAQQAFESSLGRQQQAAQLTGALGQAGAGTALQAAQLGGQLGLSAEQLAAQTGLQAGQLGLSAQQQAASNAAQLAQSGLSAEQIAAQTGLSVEQARAAAAGQRGQLGLQAAQLGMSAQQQAASNAAQLAQTGLSAEQIAAQTGLSVEQARAAAAGQMGQFGLQTGQLGLSAQQQAASNALAQAQQLAAAQQAAGQMGLAGQAQAGQQFGQAAQLGQGLGSLGLQQAQQMGQLGLQYGQLGQQDVATLGQLAQQQAALGQGLGGLATSAGQLGAQLGTLGLQQASLGELQTKLGQADIDTLMGVGGMQYQQSQAALEAERQSQLQKAYEPYQRVSFLSDIYAKTPSAQQTLSVGTSPAVSPFQQIAGLGIAGLSAAGGAAKAGLFG
jgi:hypothetical protein